MVEMTFGHLKLRINKRNRKEYGDNLAGKVTRRNENYGMVNAVRKLNAELMNIHGLLVKIAQMETRERREEAVNKLEDDDDMNAHKREIEAERSILDTLESLNAEDRNKDLIDIRT